MPQSLTANTSARRTAPIYLGDTSGLLARDGVSALDLVIGGGVALAIGTALAGRWYRRRGSDGAE